MELILISESKRQKYSILWVDLTTTQGNLIVQPGHAPFIAPLAKEKPITFMLTSGAHESIIPKAAIAHVTREKVDIIIKE
jgi:F0F1-type ATP synthase epsilon subunit